ncbi:hypothetical protein HMPREF0866_02182 [Ruminococcaceae bacterium D16]|nr:hypothetical protein HMPREF0866_02182 [Ruminococcaceae bacterium D16]
MRNLKRALSLLLSSTLVLGMLVMGGSAAGYQDVDDSNKNQEAIEVLQAVGIMTGDQNGNFNPDGSITRNEMAVIMAHLLNLDYDYYRGTNPFTDVPEWAAPYVAACAAEGVVAGIGNGQFGGDQKVTAAQASLMIMKALGYFENAEDFGSDWQVATIRQASYINLFDQINASAESALTRGQVAQLVLNGLQAKTVYFTGDKGIQIGDVTVGYRAEYTPKTGTDKKYNTLVSGKTDISEQGQYYIQLGEELYDGQLRKAPDADEFDRPAFTWSYKAQKIGTYVDWSLLVKEYTTGVTGEDLYNTLTSSAIKAYDFAYYVDGKTSDVIKSSNMIRTNDTKYTTTGNGALTQVFVDNEEEEITITTINTYLAQATADYNEKKENLSLDVKQNDGYVFNTTTVSLADIPGIEKYKEEDFVVVNVAENSNGKYDIVTVADPEVMSDTTLSKYSVNSYVVADGTQYDYAKKGTVYNADPLKAYDKTALTNYTYNVYLDKYGYIIGTEIYSGEANYLFLTGYDLNGSNLAVTTADAGAIFLDGTFSEIKIDVTATQDNLDKDTQNADYPDLKDGKNVTPSDKGTGSSEYNMWFTYNTTEKNGETIYTLAPVAANRWASQAATSSDTKINSANVRVIDNSKVAYGNDDSVYITVDTGAVDLNTAMGITKVTGTYTGVQNVDLKVFKADDNALTNDPAIMAVYDEDLYIIGAIVVGEDANATDNYAYVLEGAENEYVDSNDNYYWDFTAVVDGEIKTLTVKTKYQSVISAIQAQCGADKNGLMKLTYDVDGYVIAASVMNDGNATDKVYGASDWGTVIDAGNETLYSLRWNSGYKANFTVAGRTLYGATSDVGLTLETGAPVIVVQEEVSNTGITRLTYTAYTTISQALDSLNDKTAFEGWVSAVLNDKGTAEYIVINSADAIGFDSDDGSTPNNGKVTGVSIADTGVVTLSLSSSVAAGSNFEVTLYQLRDNGYVAVGNFTVAADGTKAPTADLSGSMASGQTYKVVCGAYSDTVVMK